VVPPQLAASSASIRVLAVFEGNCPNLNLAVSQFTNHPLISLGK
jgi:hypothetical protein